MLKERIDYSMSEIIGNNFKRKWQIDLKISDSKWVKTLQVKYEHSNRDELETMFPKMFFTYNDNTVYWRVVEVVE